MFSPMKRPLRTEFNNKIVSGLAPEVVEFANEILAKFEAPTPAVVLNHLIATAFVKSDKTREEILESDEWISEYHIEGRDVFIDADDHLVIGNDVWKAADTKMLFHPDQDPEYDYGCGLYNNVFSELFEYRWPC